LSLTQFDPVALVNRDQLDILASLRESVNDDKVALEEELARLQQQLREAAEKNRMQLEQINSLLLEKVNLQSEGIGQRERMLQRERDFGYVLTCHTKRLADRSN
jgi:protein HOOK3